MSIRVASVLLVLGQTWLEAAALEELHIFEEAGFVSYADDGYIKKCLPKWQAECEQAFATNDDLKERLCQTNLDRNYVKIRTSLPEQDILDRWAISKPWRDFQIGWYRQEVPKFTSTGFKAVKAPARLHTILSEWYKSARTLSTPEGSQPAFGFHCGTGHDNDDWALPWGQWLHAPEDRHAFSELQEHIRKMLSEWTGQSVTENTATDGVRQYHRGSVCGMHVDNLETHAFSAIYQLDQTGMNEPWAFDYVTHDGEERKTFMQPGDVMLYESASALHGRKTALNGDEFSNIFFHFRTPEWLPAIEPVREGLMAEWSKQKLPKTRRRKLADRRQWTAKDECLPLRSRQDPLLAAGGFFDVPCLNCWDFAAVRDALAARRWTLAGAGVAALASARLARACWTRYVGHPSSVKPL